MESVQSGCVKRLLAIVTKITAARCLSLLCETSLRVSFLAEVVSYTFGLLESMNHSLATLSVQQFITGGGVKSCEGQEGYLLFFFFLLGGVRKTELLSY